MTEQKVGAQAIVPELELHGSMVGPSTVITDYLGCVLGELEAAGDVRWETLRIVADTANVLDLRAVVFRVTALADR